MKANKFIIACIILLLIGIICITIPSFFVNSKMELETNGDISFYLEDKFGNKTSIDTMPSEKNYEVSVSCNKNATGTWNYELWRLEVKNLTETLTKCNITFAPEKPLLIDSIKENIVTSGNGVYEVTHDDANIEAPLNNLEKNNLKQTEYRYAGKNPNNYIQFNDELWRIIGLVNTPEGSRVKLIRNESIGNYSWDTSDTSINTGYGINEWSQADIMKLLNPGYESELIGGSLYWNSQNGNCYSGPNNANKSCDFIVNGLSLEAKTKIDTITWNVGTNGTNDYIASSNGLTKHFYNYERSNNHGKFCTSSLECNDAISRTTTWIGKVGLINTSDYGYATIGGTTTNRESCINKELNGWNSEPEKDCRLKDWLYDLNLFQSTINPYSDSLYAFRSFGISTNGLVRSVYVSSANATRPSIYLTLNQKVISGNGTESNPYILK